MRRRMVGALATSALVASGASAIAVVAASPAGAAPGAIQQRSTNQMTADALPTEQIDNGVVWSIAVSNGIAYAGGSFSNVRPPGAAAGTNLTPRGNLVAVNLATGALVSSFAPSLNGQVKAVAVTPDGKTLVVGGSFTTAGVVGGAQVARVHLAAYDIASGQLTAFNGNTNATVNGLTVSNSTVYAGGGFTQANGSNPRSRLAAFNIATGSLLGWAPTVDNNVNTMLLSPDGSRVIVGGAFANMNGVPTPGMGALDAVNGTSLPWAVNQVVHDYIGQNNGGILSLSTDGTSIYGTGWSYGAPSNFEGTFSVDPNTGNINWLEDCHGDTYDSYATGGAVYVVSHEHFCSNVGAFPETNPRTWHYSTAFTTQATGTLTTNQEPGSGYGDFAGQPSPSQINWYPTLSPGTFTGEDQAGWALSGNSQYLIEGGEFPKVNATAQYGLVRFAVPSLAPNKRGPQVPGTDPTVTPSTLPLTRTSARITWKSNWDQDDTNLTYSIYRYDQSITVPIYTTTVASQFWNQPINAYVDTGLTAGTTYKYFMRTTDSSGNSQRSSDFTVTIPGNFSQSPYAQDVLKLNPTHYWRMDSPAGTQTATDYAGFNDMTEGSTVTNGAPGAISGDSDTAATFDGSSNGVAGENTAEAGPNTFSVGAWFSTTTNAGGKIVGFGNSQLGTSGSYDRHLYMDNAGHIIFGVYNNAIYTITSPKTYNDGQYHEAVGTLSGSGMTLFIDGMKVGTNSGTTQGQAYSGYWRVGGDNLNAWPNRPASDDFAGTIDEVAVYPTALSPAQIQQQYTDSGRTLNIAPAPTDAYGKAVYADAPDLYYRLDDASGTTAADTSSNNVPGTYYGGVSLQAPSPVTGSNGTGVGFNGSNGGLSSNQSYTNPTTYSEELWFNTTTTSGGKLAGFGNQQSGASSHYDRHIYMNNGGQLIFGAYTGQTVTITSQSSYNDGHWHHVVATQGSDGMHLYVDGQLVGSNANTGAENFTGYWRVGGDNLNGWPNQPSSAYFNGTIDEVSFYLSELSATQVQNHYIASPAAVVPNKPPTASFTQQCTALSCSFDASASSDPDGTIAGYSWDFGDGTTGTGATPNHTYANGGTYTVTLTVTDNQNATGTATSQVTVTTPPPNQPPTASFTSSCSYLVCSFDGTASSDPDGTVAGYSWDFGDGTTSTSATPSHTYSSSGTYTVTLTVTDNQNATGTKTSAVTVAANQAPTASFTQQCTNLNCTFDGTASADSDGHVTGYAWSFGDGTSGSGATPSHNYLAAGTYTVTLTVTDDQGATGTTTSQLTVTGIPTYVADAFNRTVASGWGSADTGGAYTTAGGTFAVTPGAATMRMAAAGSGPTATLNAVSAANINMVVDATTNAQGTGNGISLIYRARYSSSGEYRLKVRLLPGGVVHLALSKLVSGTETVLKEVVISNLTYTTGEVLRTRFTVSGNGTTTLTGKIWDASTTEPATAQVTSTDSTASLQSAGAIGIQSYLSTNATNAPVVATYSGLTVTG
jgi:trimeric autotransporter adhesin